MRNTLSVKPLLWRVLLGQVLFTWEPLRKRWRRAIVVRCSLTPQVRLGARWLGRCTHTHSTEQETHAGGVAGGVEGVL
jgi:hypothetical protein